MRILVVEDDKTTAMILKAALTGLGHEVVIAHDGLEAWGMHVRAPFPVVVTDWEMPGLDGLDLTVRVRKMRSRVYTWIIMLTGRDADHHMDKAVEFGVDDFLEKPLDLRILGVRLKVAERVVSMGAQVAALASVIPICMHCKKVKDVGDSWRKIEHYLAESGVDLTPGYCPDCYYDHSLRPELSRWRMSCAVPTARPTVLLDPAVFQSLMTFERRSPALVSDLVEGLLMTATAVQADLKAHSPARVNTNAHGRLRGFVQRCADVGAGRAVAALTEVMQLEAQDSPGEVAEVVAVAMRCVADTVAVLEDALPAP